MLWCWCRNKLVATFYLETIIMCFNRFRGQVSLSTVTWYVFYMRHFFLHCTLFQNGRSTNLGTVKNIDSKLVDHIDLGLTQAIFSDASLDVNTKTSTLNEAIDFAIFS